MQIPSITQQRASIGLSTPMPEERAFIWGEMTIPQAQLYASAGGYMPHRLIRRLHNGPWRYVAEGGGLRGGKSLGSAAEGIAWLPHSNLIWLAGETYDLCRQEFEYMIEGATSLGEDWCASVTMPKNKYQPCAFETEWGCRVETRSLHDLGSAGQGSALTARAPDLIIICEPGFASPEVPIQSKERLTTRRGRLWMAGTFEQANTWFVDLWHKWTRWPNEDMGKSMAVPSWLNRASFPGGREDPEIVAIRRSYPTLREFLVRWGGVPMASDALVMGAYWDEKKHVVDGDLFQPTKPDGSRMPVYLAIDPGYSGNSVYAVLAIQIHGTKHVVIDEVAVQNMVTEEVIDTCRTRPWWRNVVGGTIDPNAGASHVYAGQSPQEIWWRYGQVPISVPPKYSVDDCLDRLHMRMRDPSNGATHIVVAARCARLRFEMGHWRRKKTREGLGDPSDQFCDSVKALAYFETSKYTESVLGAMPGSEEISVRDFSFTGMGIAHPGLELARRVDRYGGRNFQERRWHNADW